MNQRGICWAFWLLLSLYSVGCVSAGFTMVMTITPPTFQEGRNSTVGIELVNTGDETAYRATAQIAYPKGISADPATFERLEPNVSQKATVAVSADGKMLPGTYPLVVSLQFHDLNDYPIFMIFESMFDVGKPSTSKIYGTLSTASFPLDGSGTLTLKLKNADEEPHTVSTKLIVPQSVSADKTEETVDIQPKSEATVEYAVSNFMALPDSNFMVLTAIEYDDDSHHSSIARGRVMMKENSTQGGSKPAYFFAAAVVVIILAAYAYVKYGGHGNDDEDYTSSAYKKMGGRTDDEEDDQEGKAPEEPAREGRRAKR